MEINCDELVACHSRRLIREPSGVQVSPPGKSFTLGALGIVAIVMASVSLLIGAAMLIMVQYKRNSDPSFNRKGPLV